MEKLLLRPLEAADVLGCGRSTIYALLAEGTLPSVRIGGSVRVPLNALRAWIDEQARAAAEAEPRSVTGPTPDTSLGITEP